MLETRQQTKSGMQAWTIFHIIFYAAVYKIFLVQSMSKLLMKIFLKTRRTNSMGDKSPTQPMIQNLLTIGALPSDYDFHHEATNLKPHATTERKRRFHFVPPLSTYTPILQGESLRSI